MYSSAFLISILIRDNVRELTGGLMAVWNAFIIVIKMKIDCKLLSRKITWSSLNTWRTNGDFQNKVDSVREGKNRNTSAVAVTHIGGHATSNQGGNGGVETHLTFSLLCLGSKNQRSERTENKIVITYMQSTLFDLKNILSWEATEKNKTPVSPPARRTTQNQMKSCVLLPNDSPLALFPEATIFFYKCIHKPYIGWICLFLNFIEVIFYTI